MAKFVKEFSFAIGISESGKKLVDGLSNIYGGDKNVDYVNSVEVRSPDCRTWLKSKFVIVSEKNCIKVNVKIPEGYKEDLHVYIIINQQLFIDCPFIIDSSKFLKIIENGSNSNYDNSTLCMVDFFCPESQISILNDDFAFKFCVTAEIDITPLNNVKILDLVEEVEKITYIQISSKISLNDTSIFVINLNDSNITSLKLNFYSNMHITFGIDEEQDRSLEICLGSTNIGKIQLVVYCEDLEIHTFDIEITSEISDPKFFEGDFTTSNVNNLLDHIETSFFDMDNNFYIANKLTDHSIAYNGSNYINHLPNSDIFHVDKDILFQIYKDFTKSFEFLKLKNPLFVSSIPVSSKWMHLLLDEDTYNQIEFTVFQDIFQKEKLKLYIRDSSASANYIILPQKSLMALRVKPEGSKKLYNQSILL